MAHFLEKEVFDAGVTIINLEQRKAYAHYNRDQAIARKQCVDCGQYNPNHGIRQRCDDCLAIARAAAQARRDTTPRKDGRYVLVHPGGYLRRCKFQGNPPSTRDALVVQDRATVYKQRTTALSHLARLAPLDPRWRLVELPAPPPAPHHGARPAPGALPPF